MKKPLKLRVLPAVDEEDLSPKAKRQVNHLQAYSEGLIEEIYAFEDKVARLKDEVAILKGEKKRPIFKPSRMHEEAGKADHEAPVQGQEAKRPGSHKKSKTVQLKIDYDCIIEPTEPVPPGSRFKGYSSLNLLLLRIHKNKSELLLVLERPEIPLHTNDSERDIRDHVKKQKISGGTRSDLGRLCRDTFSSLKKTCRKLGISFWDYLTDRISCSDQIPLLHHIIEQRIASS